MRELVHTEEIRAALDLLGGGRHLFLTGKAGTGKSTLIRQYLSETDRKVVVVAPTGIAALNVDGYTLHRLFGFSATTTLDDVRTGTYRPGRFTKTLAALDTLIIDEVSMMRADLFDILAAVLHRFGPEPGTPFGGVQIVLVGDLYQLPPVVTEGEAAFFTTRYDTPYFFSADSFRRDEFPTVALTTVFRRLGDDRMTAILNEIREGVLLGHAQELLNARTDPGFAPPDDEFWLTLDPTNRLVSARNRQHLERLDGDEYVSRARQYGDLSLYDPPADELLRFEVVCAPEVPAGAAGEDIAEVLVPGARICFTGTALDDAGREVTRERMEHLATSAGLTPVKSVTKTRCEVLVTAEGAGTRSGKARKAAELGKPVFSAGEFLVWATSTAEHLGGGNGA